MALTLFWGCYFLIVLGYRNTKNRKGVEHDLTFRTPLEKSVVPRLKNTSKIFRLGAKCEMMESFAEEVLFQLDRDLRLLYQGQTEDDLFFVVERVSSSSPCPRCQRVSRRAHSRYCRNVDDLPVADRHLHFQIVLHKWFCDSPDCPTKVFTERLPLASVA